MNDDSLLSLLQQKLLSHPDYVQITHKLKSDVQTHPTRDEQRTLLSALSKYDKENKLVTTVQSCLLSLGSPNVNKVASDVLVALIKKDASAVFVLHQFLNQALPNSLRKPLWEVVFSSEGVSAKYMDAVRDKPYSTVSPQESIIKDKTTGYIQSTSGYRSCAFLHSSTAHQLMLKALSYWHIHVGRPLTDTDYKLIIPVISLGWDDADPHTVARVVALLAGMFGVLQRLKATDVNTMNIVVQYVQSADPGLGEHVMRLRPDSTATHTTSQLIAPLHNNLFVGYLSYDVIMFLLDQCVIGNDVSSHNPLFSFTATVLCLLSPALSQCTNVSSALSHIEQRGTSITRRQIQEFIQVHYLDTLSTQLSTKPTRVHFNTKPTLLGDTQQMDANTRLQDEVDELTRKLSEEKKQRNDKHIAFRNEIALIRAENESLKQKLKALPIPVPIPIPVPQLPPSQPPPIPQPAVPESVEEPEEGDDGDISDPLQAPLRPKQVQSLWLDIAKAIMQRVKRLAFKDPQRKLELDKLTLYLNKMYQEDRKSAEIDLFGAELSTEQWEGMSEEEYYSKIYEIDTVVDKLARARFEDGKKDKK